MKKLMLLTATALAAAVTLNAYDLRLRAVSGDPAEAESYATVRVFALTDSLHPCVAGLTDTAGVYSAHLDSAGTYRLTIEAAGTSVPTLRQFTVNAAEPSADLGDIELGTAVEGLREVVVTAQKPLVVKQIDRIGYDVQADPDSRTLNLQEMMRRVPMVSVDAEGNIKVNGSGDFKIFKNGRPSNSLTKNAKDILAAIPASSIKTIEVITEPGAKYDAEGIGAILNIVTTDNLTFSGVTGNARVGWSTRTELPDASLYLQSQIRKVNFSVRGGVMPQGGPAADNRQSSFYTYVDGTHLSAASHNKQDGVVGYFGAEASWDINTHNLLTAEFNGFAYNVHAKGTSGMVRSDADGNPVSGYDATVDNPKNGYFNMDGNINYQLNTGRKGETLTASYMLSNNHQKEVGSTVYDQILGDAFSYTGINTNSKLNFIEHTFQLDWTRPTVEGQTMEVGAKYVLRRNHSTDFTEYTGWRDNNSDFTHITDIFAAYAQYTAKFGPVNLRAGLRYEYSKLKADFADGSQKPFSSNLNDLVPSASASWQVNDANSLTLNYAARINRPGISYLNPAVNETPTSLRYGNPDLESAYNHSIKLTYMLIKMKFNLNFSASYSFNNDNITQVSWLNAAGLWESTYRNVGQSRTLSLSMFSQLTAGPKTTLMLNGGLSRAWRRQLGLTLAKWSPYVMFTATQTLPWKLRLQGNVMYWGRQLGSVYTYTDFKKPPVQYSLSLRRSFLKDDRLSASLSVNNPFGSSRMEFVSYTVQGDKTGSDTFSMGGAKSFTMTLSYRFGNLKAKVKKTAKRISNDDLVGQKSGSAASSAPSM